METKTIVHGVVTNEKNEFLILRRCQQNDVLPMKWDIPGGSVEDGEKLTNALKREVLEESGLSVEGANIFYMTENVDKGSNKHYIKLVFIVNLKQNNNDEKVILNPEEHDEFEWISLDDVEKYDLLDYVIECFSLINEKNHLAYKI